MKPDPAYITYTAAKQRYGVGRTMLQGLVHRGVVAAYRPGKKILLEVASLEAWFQGTKMIPRHRQGRPRKIKFSNLV